MFNLSAPFTNRRKRSFSQKQRRKEIHLPGRIGYIRRVMGKSGWTSSVFGTQTARRSNIQATWSRGGPKAIFRHFRHTCTRALQSCIHSASSRLHRTSRWSEGYNVTEIHTLAALLFLPGSTMCVLFCELTFKMTTYQGGMLRQVLGRLDDRDTVEHAIWNCIGYLDYSTSECFRYTSVGLSKGALL